METQLATTLATVITQVTAVAGDIAPKVGLAAGAGIGLGALGFGIRYIWKMFRGLAK